MNDTDGRLQQLQPDPQAIQSATGSKSAEPWKECDYREEFRPRRRQEDPDSNHLRLLSIFHYVAGGIIAFFATIPVIHVLIGIGLVTGAFPAGAGGPPPPPAMGWMFIVIGGGFILVGWSVAICLFIAGRQLKLRRRYLFCLITAGLACLFQPVGLVLGVFTFIVLLRPSVKALFDRKVADSQKPSQNALSSTNR